MTILLLKGKQQRHLLSYLNSHVCIMKPAILVYTVQIKEPSQNEEKKKAFLSVQQS